MTREIIIRTSDLNLPRFDELAMPFVVKELIKTLKKDNAEIYLIGGFVRDLILGIKSSDLDFIVIDKSTQSLCANLVSQLSGNYFLLDKETETTRLVLNDESSKHYTFDFTFVSKSKLDDDFKRRDFTINTLAVNLKEPDKLIDRFSGIEDLKQKKIRALKAENFLEDPLRFIRAFRFASQISGEIEEETFAFILNKCKGEIASPLQNISQERISVELWKIFDNDNSYKYIKQMSDIELLEKIIPELRPMRKVTPNDFHHLWLYDHSIELIKTFEENFCKIPDWAKDELNKPFGELLSPTKKAISKLACLLHDIGKPDTWEIKKIDEKEKHTFYGHDKLGAEITEKVGERLKFSSSITQTLKILVRYHLRPFQLSQDNEKITERALYRFFRDVGNDVPLLLMLATADLYATVGPKVTKEDLHNGEKLILFLFDEYKKFQNKETEKARKPKLLDGNEIMKITGLKPSPQLGKIIKDLDEAVAVGEVKTKEEASEWVLNLIRYSN